MGWVKLDDGFFNNRKVVQVSRDAKVIYLAALCHAGSTDSDGEIPVPALSILAAQTGVRKPASAARELVNAGLWHQEDAVFVIHDYLEHNTSSHERNAKRDAARERMQRNRSREQPPNGSHDVRANKSRTDTDVREMFARTPRARGRPAETETETEGVNVGGKPPTPPAREGPAERPTYPADFESWWQVYPSGHGTKKAAFEHWRKLRPDAELVRLMFQAVEGWKQSDRWKRGYVMDAQRWIRDRAWESVPPPQSAADVQGVPLRERIQAGHTASGARNLSNDDLDRMMRGDAV